jgi:hypothetical protein
MNIHSIKPYVLLVILFAGVLFSISFARTGNLNQFFYKDVNEKIQKNVSIGTGKPPAPQKNTESHEPTSIYRGKYEDQDAFYLTETSSRNSSRGTLVVPSGGWEKILDSDDFKKLPGFELMYTFPKRYYSAGSFVVNELGTKMYMTTISGMDGSSEQIRADVHVFDLEKNTSRIVWSNITEDNKYELEEFEFPTISKVINDTFMVLELNCTACGGGMYSAVLVVNLQTQKEKFFPSNMKIIGNIKFNLPTGTFTYQAMKAIKDPCIAAKNCDGIPYTRYEPEGQIYTEALP